VLVSLTICWKLGRIRSLLSCGEIKQLEYLSGINKGSKCGRTRSFLTGFHFGGIKLKDRSAGGWRSGLQRSEK